MPARRSAAWRRQAQEQNQRYIDEALAASTRAPEPASPREHARLELHAGDPGVLEERIVYSSDGERPYPMLRTPSGWQHADEGCEWWLNRPLEQTDHPCRHVRQLNEEVAIDG